MKHIIINILIFIFTVTFLTSCFYKDNSPPEVTTNNDITRVEIPEKYFYEPIVTVETEPETTIEETTAIEIEETSVSEIEETTSTVIVIEETALIANSPGISPADAESSYYYNVTEEERDMIARVVYLESGICSFECQLDTASVIFNRLDDGRWGDTISDVIYYKNAFSTAPHIYKETTVPTKSVYEAVDYVIQNGPTIPTYVRYFRINYDFKWEGYRNYKVIDNVYFGYLEGWEDGAW